MRQEAGFGAASKRSPTGLKRYVQRCGVSDSTLVERLSRLPMSEFEGASRGTRAQRVGRSAGRENSSGTWAAAVRRTCAQAALAMLLSLAPAAALALGPAPGVGFTK